MVALETANIDPNRAQGHSLPPEIVSSRAIRRGSASALPIKVNCASESAGRVGGRVDIV
jgi:hypothetical protein